MVQRRRSRSTDTVRLGRRFEAAAERHLRCLGFEFVARNVRFGRGEVDLIVREAGVVVFVEVKGRTRGDRGHPLEAVTRRKRREVEAVAQWWIRTHAPAVGYRFDAVSVEASGHPEGGKWCITHVRDAWRPGE